MIEASFGGERTRDAAVHGAYQYDTGQRIRLHGLPSPAELAERDDFLSGDIVTVQAQFAYAGDSQTEGRLAGWDEKEDVWIASVPDAYLKRSAPVTVYVYVSYGASEESGRAKTCYEAVFTPIGRPAPSDQVTEDQLNAWDELVTEVNLTLAGANTAISNTNAAIAKADAAAEDAQAIADKVDNLSVEAETLPYDSAATASISDTEDGKHIVFGIPQGKPGVFTLNGKTPDENGDITLTAADVGALTSSGTADNANKLGGVAAENYQTKELLWENASPKSTFAEQHITVSEHNYYEIITDTGSSNNVTRLKSGNSAYMMGFDGATGRRIIGRDVYSNGAGTIIFSSAKRRDTYGDEGVEDNASLIPFRIYGLNL